MFLECAFCFRKVAEPFSVEDVEGKSMAFCCSSCRLAYHKLHKIPLAVEEEKKQVKEKPEQKAAPVQGKEKRKKKAPESRKKGKAASSKKAGRKAGKLRK